MNEKDYETQWVEDSDHAIANEFFGCAKSMLEYALQNCPDHKQLWYKAITFERIHGSQEGLDELLGAAVRNHPDSAEFWMRLAKCFVVRNDIDSANGRILRAGGCINIKHGFGSLEKTDVLKNTCNKIPIRAKCSQCL